MRAENIEQELLIIDYSIQYLLLEVYEHISLLPFALMQKVVPKNQGGINPG